MRNRILILIIFLLCFCFNPAYSEVSFCLRRCIEITGARDYCLDFSRAGIGVEGGVGDYGPPEPPTQQECGKIWEKCLEFEKIEKAKCDQLKNACNENWK